MARVGTIILCATVIAVSTSADASPAVGRAPRACASHVSFGVIPAWARAGFSEPKPSMPYAIGRRGRIAGLIFGYPLSSPPDARRANKILWVERQPSNAPTALRIHAQRMHGVVAVGKPVPRVVTGGPGPSIINLPAPGCWRFTLTWSGRSDTLDLVYRKR
jgi:hypothetical protein